MGQVGLRERKKAATRALIARTAERLFAKYGYDAVTIERVADDCVVSAKTVLRYFPTKETLALARLYDLVETFREGLENHEGAVVDYWRAHVEDSALEEAGRAETWRKWGQMVHDTPRLEAHFVAITREYENLLAEALAEETGDNGLGPRLLAALLVAGNSAVSHHQIKTGGVFDPATYVAVANYIAGTYAPEFPSKRSRRAGSAQDGKRRSRARRS